LTQNNYKDYNNSVGLAKRYPSD